MEYTRTRKSGTGRSSPPERRDPIPMVPNIRTIKDGVRIETVAADYGGEFRMVGNERLVGRCLSADHDDRTPSMSIYTDTQRFRCYGCNQGGDVLDLVMLAEGCELHDALVRLSTKYAVQLPGRPDSWHRKNERQQPVRDAIEEMKVRRLQRFLFKLVEPYITDAADAEKTWQECKPLASMWLEKMQGEATHE